MIALSEQEIHYAEYIRIGYSSGEYTEIGNILAYADRPMAPSGQDQLEPITPINSTLPDYAKDKHKYNEIVFTLASDNHAAMWTQRVKNAGGGSSDVVFREDADNTPIDYLIVKLVMMDGTSITRTFQSGKTWGARVNYRFTNRRGVQHRGTATYKLICIGTVVDS